MKNQFKFLFLLFCLTCMVACKNFQGYTVSGTIKNGDHTKVYLEDIGGTQPVVIDTATILQDKFQMKNYSEKGIYRLRFGENLKNAIFLYIEDKDNIKITSDLKDLKTYTVDGSKPSADLQRVMSQARKEYEVLDSAFSRVKSAPPALKDSLQVIFDKSKQSLVLLVKDFVEKEENTDVACFSLNLLGPMMQDEIPYLVNITDKLHEADPKSKYINTWYESMKQYRDALMAETKGGVALNEPAPNIVLQNPSGDTIQLRNLLGNYILLDFWASWCGPCRQENPNVVKLYNKYHAMGFEIFSVSLDANKEQWTRAIAKDGLLWKNHGCDFGGWQSAPAQLYRVDAIPATFLIDKKGKVIAKNLRGEELDQKLSELFAAQKTNP